MDNKYKCYKCKKSLRTSFHMTYLDNSYCIPCFHEVDEESKF